MSHLDRDNKAVSWVIPLPQGEDLARLRLELLDESLDDLWADTAESVRFAQELFQVVAQQQGLDLQYVTSSGQKRTDGALEEIRSMTSLMRHKLRRLAVSAGSLTRRLSPFAKPTSPANRTLNLGKAPPGCIIRPNQKRGVCRVVMAAPPVASSRREDFLLLAQRFRSDPRVTFRLVSGGDSDLERLASMLNLSNLTISKTSEESLDLLQGYELFCSMAEAPQQAEVLGISALALSRIVTTESGLGSLLNGQDVEPVPVGDISAFERAIREHLIEMQP